MNIKDKNTFISFNLNQSTPYQEYFGYDYMNNFNQALNLACEYVHTPPESLFKDNIQNILSQYQKKFTKTNRINNWFSVDYIKHLNRMISLALKYYQGNTKALDDKEVLDKNLILKFATGILNLGYYVQQDTISGCFTIDQYNEIMNSLTFKNKILTGAYIYPNKNKK